VESGGDEVASALARLLSHAGSAQGAKYGKVLTLVLALLETQPTQLRRPHNAAVLQLLEALCADEARATSAEHRVEVSALLVAALTLADEERLFSAPQLRRLDVLALLSLVNSLYTDDSFSFSRAATAVREALAALPPFQPPLSPEQEAEQLAAALAAAQPPPEALAELGEAEAAEARAMAERCCVAERAAAAAAEAALDRRRGLLVRCCEAAFESYRWPWAQSVVEALVEAAHTCGREGKLSPAHCERLQKTYDAVKTARARRRAGGGGGPGGAETSFEVGAARCVPARLLRPGYARVSDSAFGYACRYTGAAISIRKAVGATTADGRGESSVPR